MLITLHGRQRRDFGSPGRRFCAEDCVLCASVTVRKVARPLNPPVLTVSARRGLPGEDLRRRAPALLYQVPHFRAGSGRDGGLRKRGGDVKSSASSGVLAAASRAVRAGRFHFSSRSLSTDVWSSTWEQT